MPYVQKTNHVEEALANLLAQFQNKPNFRKYIEIWIDQIQDLEDALADLLTKTILAMAEGIHLDNLGEIVGEQRFGRSDLQYRTAVAARIILNISAGTIENIIDLIRAIGGPLKVHLIEFFPAGFLAVVVDPIDPLVTDINQIATIVGSGKAGGVRGLVQFGTSGAKQFDTAGVGFDLGKFGVVVEG